MPMDALNSGSLTFVSKLMNIVIKDGFDLRILEFRCCFWRLADDNLYGCRFLSIVSIENIEF